MIVNYVFDLILAVVIHDYWCWFWLGVVWCGVGFVAKVFLGVGFFMFCLI